MGGKDADDNVLDDLWSFNFGKYQIFVSAKISEKPNFRIK